MRERRKAPVMGAGLRDGRLRLVAYGVALVFLLFLVRLFFLQIIRGENFAQIARGQHTHKVAVESRRGKILDRSGQELAVDLPQFYSVAVYPAKLKQADFLCQKLAILTGRPTWHYQRRLALRTKFLYLEWRLTKEQAQELQAANLEGVILNKTAGRFYPYDRVTAQLLGYTDVDNRGISALELYCDSVLQGAKGWEMHQRNGRGVSFWDPLMGSISPQDGGTVRLSIDIIAQEMLHQELEAACCSTQAQWVSGLLMNPRTGEILAISSVPSYDPLHPEQGDKANHKLRPFTELTEPGSIFKIVCATAALDQNVVRPSDMFNCEAGRYPVGNHVLRDAHPYGSLSFEEVLVHSSNIGMAKVSERLGARELYRYCVRFGFGTPACVEFPGEANGLLRPYDQWRDIGRANIAIGQGISVTLLQIALAYSAIANDGIMMEPRLILDVTEGNGDHYSYPPREVRRVMEPETARTLQQILAQVVERGTGKAAALDSTTALAGKTGTAQLPNLETGGYYQNRYLASFIGFMPAFDAERLLIISICDPKGAYYGAQVAAPVFRRVLQRLQPADAVRKSRQASPVELVKLPVSAKAKEAELVHDPVQLAALVGPAFLNISKLTPVPANVPQGDLTTIPDLRGLTLREALRLLSVRNVKAQIVGSGKVVYQSLPPGFPVVKDSPCLLRAANEAHVDSLATDSSNSGVSAP